MLPRFLATLCVLALVSPGRSQPLVKVPDGFKAEIVLQAPDIEAPTALCVALNGDVYFAEDPMDMAGPPTKNIDRIWLLKGGDPKKKILFADKMWAVMGLEIVRDKLYVVHAPYVTVFTLDAEGKAKERKDLFTDLGPPVAGLPSFNDHIPSGIRMGMDGWLYVSIGDKGIPRMTRKEKEQDSVHMAEGRWRHSKEGHYISLEGGGVIRFRPDGSGLEVFASGTRNHLDVPMDEHDRIFVRDNTDDGLGWNTRLMYLPRGAFLGYPWAYTQRPHETLPMIHDFGGGSPCGGWVYCDDGLPEKYRGRIFHCEWGQGKVYAVKLAPDGAGFKFVDQITFMDPEGTGVKDFRPFTLRPTADGRGFYLTDWGYSGWLNPTKAGRLWKVTYVRDDVKPVPRGKDTDSTKALIQALTHPAHSERLRAQRELATRKDLLIQLKALDKKADGLPTLSSSWAGHFLWALYDQDPSQAARWAFSRGWPPNQTFRYEVLRLLSNLDPNRNAEMMEIRDLHRAAILGSPDEYRPDALRLQTAIAYRSILDAEVAQRLLDSYLFERDIMVRHAILQTLRQMRWSEFANRVPSSELAKMNRYSLEGLCLALAEQYDAAAIGILRSLTDHRNATVRVMAVQALARNYKDRKPYAGTWWGTMPAGQLPPAHEVAWEGTPKVRDALLQALVDKDGEVRKAAVAGLMAAKDPATLEPLIQRLKTETDTEMRRALVSVIAGMETPKAAKILVVILRDHDNADLIRLEALRGLTQLKSPEYDSDIIAAAGSSEPLVLQVRGLNALGERKLQAGLTLCVSGLQSPHARIRLLAAVNLAKLAGPKSVERILPLLADKDPEVQTGVIRLLGYLKARTAVPALLRASASETTQFEALKALAQIPDPRALSAYLTGLGSKNVALRQACQQALVEVRKEVEPALEQLVQRKEIRAELFPDLREIYSSFSPIHSWRLVGPFPNDGKAYPPETEPKLDAVYQGSEKKVKWEAAQAEAGNHGKVDLARRYSPNTDVVAYGWTELESTSTRDAQLQIGSDDSIIVWLNGKKVHEHLGDRGWTYNADKANIKLHKGKNQLLIRCGNHGGPWEFSVAVSAEADRYAFLKGGTQKLDLEAFRAYARKHAGDPERGRRLFMDLKGLACVKCHALGGQGGQVGPDLAGIGLKYKREELVTSILEPSKVIAQGYETIVVSTTKGTVLTGVFKGETADAVNLTDSDGKQHSIATKDIEERSFSQVSTMPNGLNEGMTLQDFADLVAFLEARRENKAPSKK